MEIREDTLTQIANYIDISPSDFRIAQERFNAVKEWLLEGEYESGSRPEVYLQGSFRLGTVVRPYCGDRDGDFDIDQVCELTVPKNPRLPSILKHDIGNRLKENAVYMRILDDEGRRCWTLEYASNEDRPGFHLDILPSLPKDRGGQFQIDITDKEDANYDWSISNPKGYYYWFKSRNSFTNEFIRNQSRIIFEKNQVVYNEINDVPKQLIRSHLQRAIQIMKRHRDVHFSEKDHKPISIILTTIAAHVYRSDSIFGVIIDFAKYVAGRHETLLRNGVLQRDRVLDYDNGQWLVPNPVDQGGIEGDIENFADKWNEDNAFSEAFFEWVKQLKRDAEGFYKSGLSDDLNLKIKRFTEGESYASILRMEVEKEQENKDINSNNFLLLIHLAIEGKVDWEMVAAKAQSACEMATDKQSRDISKVNFYQVARHRGVSLSEEAIRDVKQILTDNPNSPAFVMCCNLLLGAENHEMICRAVSDDSYKNVLEWPIIKLAKPQNLLPMKIKPPQ